MLLGISGTEAVKAFDSSSSKLSVPVIRKAFKKDGTRSFLKFKLVSVEAV